MTTVAWRTWVEINPATARDLLKVSQGDIVAIESSQGFIEAPVYIHPGISPGVVAVPIGQGHTAYTQYARDRGANVLSILAPKTEQTTGALAWAATRVRVRPTGRKMQLPRLEGHVTPVLEEHTPLIQIQGPTGH
jgi:molybdopterin-containing oxidoreductase family iron-sulfur binding subunit